jgi:hypothetical protein
VSVSKQAVEAGYLHSSLGMNNRERQAVMDEKWVHAEGRAVICGCRVDAGFWQSKSSAGIIFLVLIPQERSKEDYVRISDGFPVLKQPGQYLYDSLQLGYARSLGDISTRTVLFTSPMPSLSSTG